MKKSDRAFIFSIKAHEGAFRKDDPDKPFIIHPMITGEILKAAGFDEEVVAAGYLHDVPEDTEFTLDDIARLFGGGVSSLVMTAIQPKNNLTWKQDKTLKIKNAEGLPIRNRAVITADKISNLEDIKYTSIQNGKVDFSNYGGDFNEQKWYYESMLEVLEEGVDDDLLNPLLDRLYHNIQDVFYTGFDKKHPENFLSNKQKNSALANEVHLLKKLIDGNKPFIIQFTKSKEKQSSLLDICHDFFIDNNFKIKVAQSKDVVLDSNVLNLSQRDSLVYAELELNFLTEISKGQDVLILQDDLFNKLVFIRRLLKKKEVTPEHFDLYVQYFKKSMDYVLVNSPDKSKEITNNAISSYLDSLKVHRVDIPYSLQDPISNYKVIDALLPLMKKEHILQLKLSLENKSKK